jgi:phosphoglycerol transferase
MPAHPWNLITIFLEGGQANFSRLWVPDRAELTPNLDHFAARAVRFGSFYNAVTPTINALISSHCGVITEIENERLGLDRGFTRSLSCLSDWLHQAGYYQVFLGGADARFAGKDLFLFAHKFDQVRGWEDWRAQATHRNEWGLDDTELVRQAVALLPALRQHGPFHLSMLTLNAHPPGFVAPDCPDANQPPSLLLAVRCTDAAIGLLLNELEEQGYFEDTVIAIVGDHTVMPSAENQQVLQGDIEGWFGRLYMAVWYPGSSPDLIRTPTYTPDFAPIVLDALNFDPVPAFPLGRSTLHDANERRTIVAKHFQVLDGEMYPPEPNLFDTCEAQQLAETIIDLSDGELLSVCERHKAIEAVDEAAETNPCPPCLW